MASQQTPNYRLSRWAGTDRILVEEFNDNWDKIDTALGVIGSYEELEEKTLENSANTISFDLSKLDWSKWQFIGVKVEVPENNIADNNIFTSNLVGASTDCTRRTGSFSCCGPSSFLVAAAPFHSAASTVKGFYVGDTGGIGYGKTPFSSVTAFQLGGSYPYPAKTRAVLWGIR